MDSTVVQGRLGQEGEVTTVGSGHSCRRRGLAMRTGCCDGRGCYDGRGCCDERGC